MFKLKKILNSKGAAPEILKFTLNGEDDYVPGSIYSLCNNSLETYGYSRVVCVLVSTSDDGKFGYGYIVTPDMILEADVYGNYEDITTGCELTIYNSDKKHMWCVTMDEEPPLPWKTAIVCGVDKVFEKKVVDVIII